MDDIRPTRSNGTPTGYGRPVQPQSQQYNPAQPATPGSIQQPNQQYSDTTQPIAEDQHPDYHISEPKKSGKGIKFALIFFIILSIAAIGFAAWQYTEVQELSAQVDELQQENARLTERVYSLNYDNRDLYGQVEMLKSEVSALDELNQAYAEECGSACDDITP